MIEVESVTKCYGAVPAVEDVSFTVSPGEIVGFVGPNGAGKSTVLKMLSTCLYPTAGKISIDGLDTVRNSLEVRRRIGYLSGDTPLYQNMRVDRFLRFVGQAHGLRREALQQGLERTVEICGLKEVLSKRIGRCPSILILDEPTHGFDPLQVLAFRDLLNGLSPGRTILFSSHIIQELAVLCGRILILHNGRLLADGSLQNLAEATGQPAGSLEAIFTYLVGQSETPSHA